MHALKPEDRQFTLNPKPAALLFKERSGLANHPLSCHPQRGVWQPRKLKKSKENERKRKAAGKLTQCSVFHLAKKFVPGLLQDLGLYRFQEEENTKCHQFTLIHQGQNGKKSKRDTRKSKCQRQHEQWCRKEFSHHGAKFSASAPSFLLILIWNVEFDSNSSCVDRLNNLGINSLQKLQN